MIVVSMTAGILDPCGGLDIVILATVPSLTGVSGAAVATPPFNTLVKNNCALSPSSLAVMSHGPLMTPPEKVSTGLPCASSTIRHPAPTVAIVPSVVGKLPTITHPVLSTTHAVVSPTPPGQPPGRVPALISAKVVWL